MAKDKIKEEEKPEKQEKKINWLLLDGESKSEEEFVTWLDEQVKNHPVVKVHHGKWKELIAWEEGEQFSEWNEKSGAVTPVELNIRKKRLIVNLLKPLIETLEGKINFSYSIIGVPNSTETKDIRGAQVATKMISYNDSINDMPTIMEDAKEDLLRPGIACLKRYWNKDWHGIVAPTKDGAPDKEKTTEETGEVCTEVVPVFNIRPDPTAKKESQLRWILEIKEVTRQELLKKFPKAEKQLDELVASKNEKYQGRYVKKEEEDESVKTYLIKEYWEKASIDYPDGRLIIACNDKIIYTGKNPSPKAWLPYFFLFYRKSPYSFWPKGPLHYTQGIQREFNRNISITSEHIESWRPKMAVGKGALKTANSFTVEALEVVEVDFTRGEPRPIAMPQLSPEVAAHRDFLIGAIDRVSNIHEVSYARLPQYASRAPASLYAQMLEQERNKLDKLIIKTNATLLRMAKFSLMLMDQHYTIPRMVKIIGPNKKSAIEYFSKADLNQNFDVQLEMGVSLSQSPTIQTRLLIELWSQGILNEKDKPKILKLLSLGIGEPLIQEDLADTEKALRENQAFIDDIYEKPREEGGVFFYIHDDDLVHLEHHTNLAKSEDVQKWPEKKYSALDEHIMKHLQKWVLINSQGQGALLKEQQEGPGVPREEAPGAPPPPPGPIPPPAAGPITTPGIGVT